MTRVVIAGIGSEYRSDDGVGIAVAELLETTGAPAAGLVITVVPRLSAPLDLLGHWDGADLAIVIDATRSGHPPGTVQTFDFDDLLVRRQTDWTCSGTSWAGTHGMGLIDVLRLARSVGRSPVRVIVVGIEGSDFGHGKGMSPPVEDAVPEALAAVVGAIRSSVRCV